MKLTYQPLENDEVLRVACEGLVSTRGQARSSEPLLELLGPHCYRQKVVLNLERSEGTDTSGLMWLARVATRFVQGGGRFVVYGFSPTFRNMLEVLGITGMIALASTESLAIDWVNRPPEMLTDNGQPRALPRAFPPPTSDAS
jgi:anti-anti-sigma regulatory factor